ncbi:TPA: hypothetical protein H1012_02115 [archaeon]|nr:hypothetical protein [Candidatus Naiadarchaeales archaeon SRR2090159.bin1288]
MAELTKSVVNPTPKLKKEKWVDETYGEMPFKTVRKVTMKVSGMKSPPYAAHLQYNLLVNDSILRALVDFRGTVEVVYEPNSITKEEIKALIEGGIKSYDLTTKHIAEIVKDEEMPYRKVAEDSFNLTARELNDKEKVGGSFNHMGTGGKESLV